MDVVEFYVNIPGLHDHSVLDYVEHGSLIHCQSEMLH